MAFSELNSDILRIIIDETLAHATSSDRLESLLTLSVICRSVRNAALPYLFSDVKWPHRNKHDGPQNPSQLWFVPETLWPLIRKFHLAWPDQWSSMYPSEEPPWKSAKPATARPLPGHMVALIDAIPNMSFLTTFVINCTFVPPAPLLCAIFKSPSIAHLSIHDTPMNSDVLESLQTEMSLESLSLSPVAQAVRVGEGHFDPKFGQMTYYISEYRKYFRESNYTAAEAASLLIKTFSPTLRHLDVSGALCMISSLASKSCNWSNLQALILTGSHPLTMFHGFEFELADVLQAMPALTELRVLFTQQRNDGRLFPLLPISPNNETHRGATPAVFGKLRSLAVSNACDLRGVLVHTTALERFAVCALINHPRVPTALGLSEMSRLLADISEGGIGNQLRHVRVMIENELSLSLCKQIADLCPNLSGLEIEQCGYHARTSSLSAADFADALAPLRQIRRLRICIPFEEHEDSDAEDTWRIERREYAEAFAARFPLLQSIGFECRQPTGTYSYRDGWLDFEICLTPSDQVQLIEVEPSWYVYPEMWTRTPITS